MVEDVVKVMGASAARLSMDDGNGGVVGDGQVKDAIVLEGAMQGISVEKARQRAAAVVRDEGGSDEDASVCRLRVVGLRMRR